MILGAARILVTVLSVACWQRCLSDYTYGHPQVPFTEPDITYGHTNQLSSEQLTAAQCVARYATSEFRLQSPGFPAPYPTQLQCLYIVEAVSTNICRLQVNFLTFDLGECTSDHVVIAGQKLCGNLSGTRTFRFSSPRSLILFRYGGVSGRKGFNVAINQVPCPQLPAPNRGCSRDFSSSSVVLQSPGYPGPYPGNTRCQYVIHATTTGAPELSLCQAQFTFDTFSVDISDGCTKDRLEIGDQEPICGYFNGIGTYEFLGELHVDFFSDGIGNDGGFRIDVTQLHCRTLNVPDGGELPPSLLPAQRQRPMLLPQHQPSVLPPLSQPPVLPPQPQPPLLPPQLQPPLLPPNLPPSVFTPQPQLSTLPLRPLPPVLPPPPPLQPMTHASQFLPPLCCNQVNRERIFFIASPGFPFSNANYDIDCVYDIRPYSTNACGLKIVFKMFWVGQPDGNGLCSEGFLKIDGRFYCDCIIGHTVVTPFEFWGHERKKILHFRMQGNVRNPGGFFLLIFQEDCMGWSPRNGHYDDGDNVAVPWAGTDHNISSYGNVGFGAYSVADGITLEEHNNSVPYKNSETDWQRAAYFSKGETAAYVDSSTVDRSVTNTPGSQNQDYRVFHGQTNAPFDGEKDRSHNDTKHCNNDSSPVDNSNTSAVNLCLFDATSVPTDFAANGGCQSCAAADCTSGDICTGVTRIQTSEDRGTLQVKPPATRREDLSELQAEDLLPLQQGACGLWSFAHWLLQAKQFLWMLFPQLLCPINSPLQSSGCQVLNQARGWLQSPRYPRPYPNKDRWCYRFQHLQGYCQVQLYMLDFGLPLSQHCVGDHFLIGGQWRYCGDSLHSTGIVLDMSAAQRMDVLLVSGRQQSGRGFRAFYQHIPCQRREGALPADCGQVINGEQFTVTGSGSMVHRSCVYRILRHGADVCSLRLNFTDFSLPCGAEYMMIDERTYCGDLAGRTVEVDFFKPEVRIVHNRMDPRSRGHFTIQGKQLQNCDFGLSEVPLAARVSNFSTQCEIQLSEVRGFVASPPNHLSSYQPVACAYVIQPHKGMCAVRVAFGAFNVPSAANCLPSFMELHRQKFCNNQLEQRTTVVDFGGGTLRVPFHVGGSGTYYWNFRYTQLPCSEAVQSEQHQCVHC